MAFAAETGEDTRKLLSFSNFAFASNTKFSRSLGKLPPASPRTAAAEAEVNAAAAEAIGYGAPRMYGSGGLHLAPGAGKLRSSFGLKTL